jgi:hypothetical protein
VDLASRGVEAVEEFIPRGVRYFLTPTDGAWAEHPGWSSYLAERATIVHRDPEFLIFRFH